MTGTQFQGEAAAVQEEHHGRGLRAQDVHSHVRYQKVLQLRYVATSKHHYSSVSFGSVTVKGGGTAGHANGVEGAPFDGNDAAKSALARRGLCQQARHVRHGPLSGCHTVSVSCDGLIPKLGPTKVQKR